MASNISYLDQHLERYPRTLWDIGLPRQARHLVLYEQVCRDDASAIEYPLITRRRRRQMIFDWARTFWRDGYRGGVVLAAIAPLLDEPYWFEEDYTAIRRVVLAASRRRHCATVRALTGFWYTAFEQEHIASVLTERTLQKMGQTEHSRAMLDVVAWCVLDEVSAKDRYRVYAQVAERSSLATDYLPARDRICQNIGTILHWCWQLPDPIALLLSRIRRHLLSDDGTLFKAAIDAALLEVCRFGQACHWVAADLSAVPVSNQANAGANAAPVCLWGPAIPSPFPWAMPWEERRLRERYAVVLCIELIYGRLPDDVCELIFPNHRRTALPWYARFAGVLDLPLK